VAGTGFGLVVLGLEDALCTALGSEPGDGFGDDARPGCAAQWNGIELAGHFGAAATDTRVSLPDARQAVTVTCWPDAAAVLAKFAVSGERLSAGLAAWLPASA
jgi:hypothetical protein